MITKIIPENLDMNLILQKIFAKCLILILLKLISKIKSNLISFYKLKISWIKYNLKKV